MNFLKIEECESNNGYGFGTTLYLSGCPRRCKGCFNQAGWKRKAGTEFTEENYEYLDFGRLFAEEQCSPGKEQKKDFPYECLEEEQLARGYKRIFIKDGIEQIEFNLQDSLKENPDDFSGTIISDQEIKARLLTYDEVIQYDYDDSAPDWLIDHLREKEGYWTASSSTFPTSNYTMGAFAIVNYKGKPSIREVYTVADSNDDFKKIGIRPVIEIQK